MLYFSKLRILFIFLFSLLFVLIASSNLFKFDDSFFSKKINLGLDLQGGSYLLLEIDNEPVIEQKLQNLTTVIRNYFKDKDIKINNIKIENKNIFFNVADENKQSVIDVFKDANVDAALAASVFHYGYISINKLFETTKLQNDFEILSVLRNIKIIGIFTRLSIRDKKKKYLKLIPRA